MHSESDTAGSIRTAAMTAAMIFKLPLASAASPKV